MCCLHNALRIKDERTCCGGSGGVVAARAHGIVSWVYEICVFSVFVCRWRVGLSAGVVLWFCCVDPDADDVCTREVSHNQINYRCDGRVGICLNYSGFNLLGNFAVRLLQREMRRESRYLDWIHIYLCNIVLR